MTEPLDLTYANAIDELAEILELLEDPHLDVDQLAERVERGKHLVVHCRSRLSSAELAVKEILGDEHD